MGGDAGEVGAEQEGGESRALTHSLVHSCHSFKSRGEARAYKPRHHASYLCVHVVAARVHTTGGGGERVDKKNTCARGGLVLCLI